MIAIVVVVFVILIVALIIMLQMTTFNIGNNDRQHPNLSRYLAHHRSSVRVVFSLSTLPTRIGDVHETVQELLNSSIHPDAVYLNVPKESIRLRQPYHVTSELRAIALSDTRFILNDLCEDFGPATKLLPTLKAEVEPETIIITADDDIFYPINYHEELLEQQLRHPDTAFGYRGVIFKNNRPIYLASNPGPTQIIEGFTGAIYRRRFFTDSIFDVNVQSPCFFTDDIYISAHLGANNVPRELLRGEPHNVGMGRKGLPVQQKKNSKTDPLHIENHTGRNTACYLSLAQFFEHM